jgi:hypothetical protein
VRVPTITPRQTTKPGCRIRSHGCRSGMQTFRPQSDRQRLAEPIGLSGWSLVAPERRT